MRPLALISLLAASLLAFGCVSKDELLRKSDEAAACAKNLAKAAQDNQALSQELAAAKAGLADARRGGDECAAQSASLRRERDDLRSQLTASQESQAKAAADRDAAKARQADLQRQVDQLNRQKEEELAKLKATYDGLVGSLKGEIEAGQVQITRMKDRLSVNLVEKILFDSGRDEIKPAGLEVLKKVGDLVAKVQDKRIQIEGHTDNVPISGKLQERFPSNWELSSARALAVVHFLQDKVGLSPTLISGAGYGEYQPALGNDNPEGKAANRRIEIVLLPLYERASEAQEKAAAPGTKP